jgi:hypothetical protein
MANYAINASPRAQQPANPTPLAAFSNSNVASNPKHWHDFGCPAYVLAETLQGGVNIFQNGKGEPQ